MPVYLKYDSIYTDSAAFNANDITVNSVVRDIYYKHVDNGNIVSWNKQDFPETLTKTISIGYRDSDAYNAHLTERQQLLDDIDAPWVTNTNFRLEDSI
jgi:hypothetical protein